MNPEYSDEALPVEFGPSYENKKSQKPVKGLDKRLLDKVRIRGQ